MPANRYAPPSAALHELDPLSQDVPSRRRPIVIWLMLTFAGLFASLFGAGTLMHLLHAVTGNTPLHSVLNAGVLAAVTALFLVAGLAVFRRKRHLGRTLGTSLRLLSAVAIWVSGAPDYSCSVRAACNEGWWLGRLTVCISLVALAWLAGFSPGARQYYGRASKSQRAA